MTPYLCVQCGVQFAETEEPPDHCPICTEERQYVNPSGQQWTTLESLRTDHRNALQEQEVGLVGIGTEPHFAIGQRALLVQTPGGNVLWDCISLLDEATVEAVRQRGGLKAIAISHPHFYSSCVEWSRAFGDVPIYLHAADRRYMRRPDPAVVFWEGDTLSLNEVGGSDLTLIRCGGHFAGATVLHWPQGADGQGALLTGDTITVVADRRYVSFMYSYPNLIPLSAFAVRQIVSAVEPYSFDRIYGGWWSSSVTCDAKAAIHRSAERYIAAIEK